MIIRATISSPTDALIPNKIVRTKVVTLKFGSGITVLDAPPAGSITGAMLQDGAVTTPKLADGAVTTEKIAKRAVKTEQLAEGAVTTGKIEPGAVDWNRLDYDTQQAILAGGGGAAGGVIPEVIQAELRKKYNKAGGRISGAATVGGDLTVERSVHVEDDLVVDRDITARRRTTTRELEVDDRATFRGVAQSDNFVSGPTGKGWRIDRAGNGEMESLVLRRFLETPELRKNKISVIGDEFWVSAAGLIESVSRQESLPVYTQGGRQIRGRDGRPWRVRVGRGYVVRFKLEEGDSHAFRKDDILVSKFEQEGGFQTAWFRVKYVLSDREVFLVPLNGYAPRMAMNVARQGNFTDPERQNSIYISGKEGYIRVLSGVDSTEIRFENIRCQYGNLEGVTVPGIGALHGYGEYSDNAYKRGVFLMQGGQRVEDFVRETVEVVQQALGTLQDSLGGLAFQDKVEKALLGQTIISGGYIRSELIAVDDALVERLIASEAFIDKLVARAVSTQAGDNPQRVEIQRGEDAIRVYDSQGRNLISMTTDGGMFPQLKIETGVMSTVMDLVKIRHQIESIAATIDQYGFHMTDGDTTLMELDRHNGLNIPGSSKITLGRGSTVDMPGVLAAGRVSKDGSVLSQWGCKSCSATKYNGQTGKYKITHNIGHTNYFVQATPSAMDNTWAKVHAIILDKTDSYVVVAIYDSGTDKTGKDTDFEFLIVGDK